MPDTDTFLYFAYGSNMSSRRLRHPDRAPSAEHVGQAFLCGYRLTFDKVSKDGSGKADCEHTGNPTDRVYGGLYRVSSSESPALDAAEGARGAKPGYRRVKVVVQAKAGEVGADTYTAIGTHKQTGLLPFPWYVQHVLFGAQEFELPAAYVEEIRLQATQADLDEARIERELSCYTSSPGS